MNKAWILPLLLLLPGCIFSERSFPYDPAAREAIALPAHPDHQAMTARGWLAEAAPRLAHLLPHHRRSPMLTDDLAGPRAGAADVWAHFDRTSDGLESIFVNFLGLAYSAQAVQTRSPLRPAPPWDGFEDMWIPVAPDLRISARIGWAHDPAGRVADADCIVIVPGIRGDNNILRVRDLAEALRSEGFHVLTVELRGTGLTDRRHPKYDYTWGIYETDDLLRVADWAQARPHVRRTGLVGYSWGANHAILAAWAQGRTSAAEGVGPELAPLLRPAPIGPKRFEAGVLVFSPICRFEELIDKLEVEQPAWLHPALAGLQETFRTRMADKNIPGPCGSVRTLLKHMVVGNNAQDAGDEPIANDRQVAASLEYVRLMPYKDLPAHDKLGRVPMPLLIVHAADDMIAPAQDLADLLAPVNNPNVAAMILPSGGHIGFAPYASAWYYNLIFNFFDPKLGPAAAGK
jgi:pimeloyl-ACP methyl ester carboxylesterase